LEVQSDELMQAKQAINTQSTTTTDCACKWSINLVLHLSGVTNPPCTPLVFLPFSPSVKAPYNLHSFPRSRMSLISFLDGTTNSAISSRTLRIILLAGKDQHKPISLTTRLAINPTLYTLSCQMSAVPDLCCIVTQRLVESVGGEFDPFVSSKMNSQ